MPQMNIEQVLNCNFTSISNEYRNFAKAKHKCSNCSVFDGYKQVIQSEGNAQNPTFVIIGEGAGEDELMHCRPFIGRAGQRLRLELKKHPKTFNKETTLISNILPCRPQNNLFPKSSDFFEIRDAKSTRKVKGRDVVNYCVSNWLRKEITILQPKVLILLGAQALYYMRGDSGITSHRGEWKFLGFKTNDGGTYKGWTTATYHPSYVLRCQNDPDKKYVVEQFQEDFARIVSSWSSLVNNDPNMQMPWDEWRRETALIGASEHASAMAASPVNFKV